MNKYLCVVLFAVIVGQIYGAPADPPKPEEPPKPAEATKPADAPNPADATKAAEKPKSANPMDMFGSEAQGLNPTAFMGKGAKMAEDFFGDGMNFMGDMAKDAMSLFG